MQFTISISPGELVDRLSVLELKAEHLEVGDRLTHVESEIEQLRPLLEASRATSIDLEALEDDLRAVNRALWEIEDAIRACEAKGDFGDSFVALARSIYKHNDRRSHIKQQINGLLRSTHVEVKCYSS